MIDTLHPLAIAKRVAVSFVRQWLEAATVVSLTMLIVFSLPAQLPRSDEFSSIEVVTAIRKLLWSVVNLSSLWAFFFVGLMLYRGSSERANESAWLDQLSELMDQVRPRMDAALSAQGAKLTGLATLPHLRSPIISFEGSAVFGLSLNRCLQDLSLNYQWNLQAKLGSSVAWWDWRLGLIDFEVERDDAAMAMPKIEQDLNEIARTLGNLILESKP